MNTALTPEQQKYMENIITQIAQMHGVTEEEVRRDITEVIVESMKTPDPVAQELWRHCPCAGDIPTPEEFIFWNSVMVADSLNQQWSKDSNAR